MARDVEFQDLIGMSDRLSRVEQAVITLTDDVSIIKNNHLAHIQDSIQKIEIENSKSNMKIALIVTIITFFVTILSNVFFTEIIKKFMR